MFGAILIGLALGYAVLAGSAFFLQGKMLYYPERDILITPRDIGYAYENIGFTSVDGVRLSGWYVPSDDPRGVILFCHGNAGNISHRLDSIRIFLELQLSVFIFDYRGYGKSEGSPTEEGTYLDAEAAWDFLVRERAVSPQYIILFGRSLGAAVAAELAVRRQAGALILESGFTSVPDLGAELFPYLPVRVIAHYRYAAVEKVAGIRIPKLIIHSPEDEIIPFSHGRRLYEHAAEPKEFLSITGGHNEGFLISGQDYRRGLSAFLSRALPE